MHFKLVSTIQILSIGTFLPLYNLKQALNACYFSWRILGRQWKQQCVSFSFPNHQFEETASIKQETVSTYPYMCWVRLIDQFSWYNESYNCLQGCRVNICRLSHKGTNGLPTSKLNNKDKHDNFEMEQLTHPSSEKAGSHKRTLL